MPTTKWIVPLAPTSADRDAERYAHSYIPLTMDPRDYMWGDADMDAIDLLRKERLADLDDDGIQCIMSEHKEMVSALYDERDIAKYYPGIPSTDEGKNGYRLNKR